MAQNGGTDNLYTIKCHVGQSLEQANPNSEQLIQSGGAFNFIIVQSGTDKRAESARGNEWTVSSINMTHSISLVSIAKARTVLMFPIASSATAVALETCSDPYEIIISRKQPQWDYQLLHALNREKSDGLPELGPSLQESGEWSL